MKHGDDRARNRLIEEVYDELYRLAGNILSQQGHLSDLEQTELVNTACRRLLRTGLHDCSTRDHIVGVACRAMRSALVDHARRNGASKRPRNHEALDPSLEAETEAEFQRRAIDLEALDVAMKELASLDEQAAKLVEMRFFGGLPMARVAEILGISLRTADRRWKFARRWLRRKLS